MVAIYYFKLNSHFRLFLFGLVFAWSLFYVFWYLPFCILYFKKARRASVNIPSDAPPHTRPIKNDFAHYLARIDTLSYTNKTIPNARATLSKKPNFTPC